MKLICPICRAALHQEGNSLCCANHHCFDIARQGYVNLDPAYRKERGDNREMVLARTSFLSSGAYSFLKNELSEMIRERSPEVLADLGCGEGYYTSSFPAPEKYGFDLSRDALKHAAKHDSSTRFVISSIFHLPLAEESCDLAITCFAPAAEEEIVRILKPGGYFLYVIPGRTHLQELKEILYEHPYENEEAPLKTQMKLIREQHLSNHFEADQEMLKNLFQMTPYAYRTGEAGKKKLEAVSFLTCTAEFVIRCYQKNS